MNQLNKYYIFAVFLLILGLVACTSTTEQLRSSDDNQPSPLPVTVAPPVNTSERRIALIIGNGAYQYTSELKNAVNDASAIRAELKKKGFMVQYHENASRNQMFDAVEDFIPRLSANTIGLVFYAGHGVQIRENNYLLPIDIKVRNERDVVRDGTSLQNLLTRMGEQQAKFSLAIIDACRDNPFKYTAAGQTRTVGRSRGLAKQSSTGVMVVYSAGANQTALDWLDENDRDPNGLFTREFLKTIREPGLTVREVIQKTRDSVYAKAQAVRHLQMPALYDEAVGSFIFTPGERNGERNIDIKNIYRDIDLEYKTLDKIMNSVLTSKDDGLTDRIMKIWFNERHPTRLKIWLKAAKKGHANAQLILTLYYFSIMNDPQSAFIWGRKASDNGNDWAQLLRGIAIGKGLTGEKPDIQEGFKWIHKSALQGNMVAQYMAGICFVQGLGTKQNIDEAMKMFRAAASKGLSYAKEVVDAYPNLPDRFEGNPFK